MVDVSVIIVNYNTIEITNNCISSIIEKTEGLSYEIILVDNASVDGSREFFSKRTDIIYVWSNENLGFGKANNLGYSKSNGRYVFLLNSDTILLNNALKFFVEAADNELELSDGVLGCMLENGNGQRTHSYASFPTIWNDLFKEAFLIPISKFTGCNDFLRQGLVKPDFPVDYIIGADLFIRRDVIEQYGFFDSRFFMYYEDVELQWRYHQQGIRSVIIDGPKIIHLEGGSAKTHAKKKLSGSIMRLRSKLTYFSITTDNCSFSLYRFILLIVRIPFLIFSKYKFDEKKKYLSVMIHSY